MKARIFLVTKLHSGIAGAEKYSGDVSDFAAGRNGVAAAVRALSEERLSNRRSFGSEGAGGSWLELRDDTGTYRLSEIEEQDGIDLSKKASELNNAAKERRAYAKSLDDMERAGFDAGFYGHPLPRLFDISGITPYEVERGYRDGISQKSEWDENEE